MAKKAAPVKPGFWQNDRNTGLVLAGITLLLFASTIGFDYALDDRAVIANNDFVHEGFHGFGKILKTFYWAGFKNFATANSGLFRPMSLLLFATEWQFAPGKPHFYHFTNVVLFALCIYQLYRLLRELFRDQSVMLALLSTLLFLALPIHTEVTANIKSADEILSLLFCIISFRQLLKWSENGKNSPLVFSGITMLLALLSKEGAVLVIPMMLLALLMFRGKKTKELMLPASYFFGITVMWLYWHHSVIANGPEEIIYDYRNNALLSSASTIDRIGTAIGMQARYWVKMLAGYPLSYNYSFNEIPVDGFASLWTWIALAGIGTAIYCAWKNFKTNPVVSWAIIFYFVTFALTSNIFYLIGDTFAERLAFVPSIGFVLLLSWLILKFTKGTTEKRFHAPTLYAGGALFLLYAALSFNRSQDWQYESTLFTADVSHAPNSARVHDNYGVVLLNQSDSAKTDTEKRALRDQALSEFITAVTIDSLDIQATAVVAQLQFERGNYREAIRSAQQNVRIFDGYFSTLYKKKMTPTDRSVFHILGNSFISLGKYDSAEVVLTQGDSLFPSDENFEIALGNNRLAQKDTSGALQHYTKATTVNPKSVTAWDKLGNIYGMKGDYAKSTDAFLELVKLDPQNLHAYSMLYMNAKNQNDPVKMKEYEQAYHDHGGK